MKFIFFVHYFPPLNSTGSRRVQSFAKYLLLDGHEVVVMSTRKTTRDGPLTESIPPGIRLYELDSQGQLRYSETAVATEAAIPKKIHWTRRLRQWLARYFGQLLDHRITFALAFRSKRLDRQVIDELATADVLVSSFPPWPAHLAGFFARKRFKKPWIADYRDQFSANHIMRGGWLSDRLELLIDRAFLRRADAVTVISAPMQAYYESFHPIVKCIENGYEGDVFDNLRERLDGQQSSQSRNLIVIRYMGTITRDRIPRNLLAALESLEGVAEASGIRFEFFGDTRILENYIAANHANLSYRFTFKPAVPYLKSLEAMLTADALLFVETSDVTNLSARGVLTTKLFEYLASRRLILAEIDDSTLAASYILRASGEHVVTRDPSKLAVALRQMTPNRHVLADESFVSSLSREQKAREFEKFATELVRNNL